MPVRPTALTAATGEHYVAFQLCKRGYSVGLTRGGSPGIDLFVTNQKGSKSVLIQVKTKVGAYNERKRKHETSYWDWFVGKVGWKLKDNRILYAFVNLKKRSDESPEVFIVPSKDVIHYLGPRHSAWSIPSFRIDWNEKDKYLERWDIIKKLL